MWLLDLQKQQYFWLREHIGYPLPITLTAWEPNALGCVCIHWHVRTHKCEQMHARTHAHTHTHTQTNVLAKDLSFL